MTEPVEVRIDVDISQFGLETSVFNDMLFEQATLLKFLQELALDSRNSGLSCLVLKITPSSFAIGTQYFRFYGLEGMDIDEIINSDYFVSRSNLSLAPTTRPRFYVCVPGQTEILDFWRLTRVPVVDTLGTEIGPDTKGKDVNLSI